MKTITTIFHAITALPVEKENNCLFFLSVQKRAFIKDTADFTPIDDTLRVIIASLSKNLAYV